MYKLQNLINDFGEQYKSYLSDESKLVGVAESISFPKNTNEIIHIINELRDAGKNLTIQGGRTGLVGSAVPLSNHILNLSEFKQKIEVFQEANEMLLKVSSGFTLEEIYDKVRASTKNDYFLPIEPSEKTATIGGVLAQNAKGLTSYKYGEVIDHIKQIKILDYTGETNILCSKDEIEIYIGSEGMYGVILEVVFKLKKKPANIWSLVLFFHDKYSAMKFSKEVCSVDDNKVISLVEYLDYNSIKLLQEYRSQISSIENIPDISEDVKSMIILELCSDHEENIESFVGNIMMIAESHNCNLDISWALTGESEASRIRNLRHAIVEIVNMKIAKLNLHENSLYRIDINVFGEQIIESLIELEDEMINNDIDYCVYGHIGNMSLIVSVIPKDANKSEKAREIITKVVYGKIHERSSEIYEFGIGKTNSQYYLISGGVDDRQKYMNIKGKLDPIGIFNPYNITQANIEIIKNQLKGCEYE